MGVKAAVMLMFATFTAGGALAAPAQSTQAIIDDCESCHGEGGASKQENIAVIGGMSAFYLDAQLHAYQDGYRPCEQVEYPAGPEQGEIGDMCKEVEGLSDEQIARIADYFAEQPFAVPDQQADPALTAKGENLHQQHCAKCHSDGGGLAFDDAGILAGQWRGYLRQTFQEFRSGARWQPEEMVPKVEELSDEDVRALVEFYVGQEPVQ
jgi:cytochrome c553